MFITNQLLLNWFKYIPIHRNEPVTVTSKRNLTARSFDSSIQHIIQSLIKDEIFILRFGSLSPWSSARSCVAECIYVIDPFTYLKVKMVTNSR
jgi:hypothetical protein